MSNGHLLAFLRQIFTNEGYFDPIGPEGPNRPQRNRNPADLRDSVWLGQDGNDAEKFCIFRPFDGTDFPESGELVAEMKSIGARSLDFWGYRAARLDVTNHAAKYPGQTLLQFVAGDGDWPGYAPASDANDSAAYADALAKAIGVTTGATFQEL